MGVTKTDPYSERLNTLAVQLKALAHPARIAIVEYLLQVNACICGDIVNELPLAQATVSQHLRELKNAGIIQGTIEGNAICYCLNPNTIAQLQSYFTQLNTQLSLKNNACC